MGCGIISKIAFEIRDDLLVQLENRATNEESSLEDLIEKYILYGLKNQKGLDTMHNIHISEEIFIGITNWSNKIQANPEKLVNSILYDYLMKVKDIPSTRSGDEIWRMLEHDNPSGDDTLKKLRQLGDDSWK